MRTPDIEGVAIHDGPSHASASVRALGLLDFDGPRGTSAPSLGRVAAASPRVRCRALFTCLDFERADLDQVDSVARIDESSAFGLTVITMSGVTSRGASMRRRLPAPIVALVSACAVLAGCSTDSGVNAQTLESTGPATSVSLTAGSLPASASSPVPVSFAPASTTAAAATDGGVSAQETADRAAVEAQWIKSWDAYAALAHTPGDQRAALAGTVAVDPALTNMLTDAQTLTGKGWDTYGQIAHRISWRNPSTESPARLSPIARTQASPGHTRQAQVTSGPWECRVITCRGSCCVVMTGSGEFNESSISKMSRAERAVERRYSSLVILMMAAWSPASAGPQDDPTVPTVAITPGGGGFVTDDERTYSATLTLAGALADQTLESGQAAQALAAAAAARQAARSDTDSPAADGSAVSTAAADTSWRSRERPDLAGWAAVIRCHQQIALAEPSFRYHWSRCASTPLYQCLGCGDEFAAAGCRPGGTDSDAGRHEEPGDAGVEEVRLSRPRSPS